MKKHQRGGLALASAVIALISVAASGTALAARPSTSPSLKLAKNTTTWTTAVGDGGSDADGYSIKIVKAAHGPAAGATLVNGTIIGLHLSQVSALSFDIQGDIGGGSPRINLGLSDSNVVFASAERQGHLNCDVTSGTWSHIDFMADNTAVDGCTLNTRNDNATNTEFTSNGSSTAWQQLVAAHPDVTITSASLIEDQGPATTYIDNLTFGPDAFTQP